MGLFNSLLGGDEWRAKPKEKRAGIAEGDADFWAALPGGAG